MSYYWEITKDLLHENYGGSSTVGVCGPMGARKPENEKGVAFRMKDDDGEVCVHGRFYGDARCEDAFGPLDDFGEPGLGCTSIEYWEDGWKTL